VSTIALVFLLNHATSHVRFFLTFAIIILTYSLAKFLHLPSLILVLCFGLVLNNFRLFNYPIVRKLLSFDRLNDANKELKLMTAETAFIIRTFFFLLFGYSVDLALLKSTEVLLIGLAIISLTIVLRFFFLRFLLKINSAPLTLIAPRGLITVLLFYSIPEAQRMQGLSEGVLFIVIVFTGLAMTIGLLLSRQSQKERIEDII
jgi:NhaP-type Na+/H+ or K+/H+ antiporter